jgi:hypothetical protein
MRGTDPSRMKVSDPSGVLLSAGKLRCDYEDDCPDPARVLVAFNGEQYRVCERHFEAVLDTLAEPVR